MGKASLGLEVAVNVAREGAPALVISLEMQATQLGRRALAMDSGLPLATLRSGLSNTAEAAALVRAQRSYADLLLSIGDQGGMGIEAIASQARNFRSEEHTSELQSQR